VIENEFGEVSVDEELLAEGASRQKASGAEVVLMPNGCLCCRSRADLAEAFEKVLQVRGRRVRGLLPA
jgi:G3E family GTPase